MSSTGVPWRSPAAVLRFVGVAALGLAADLITKVWAFKELAVEIRTDAAGKVTVLSDTYAFIPGWLHFTTTANQGAVFGAGQGFRWVFVLVSVAAIGFLAYLFATSLPKQRWYQVLLGMLLAGVLGNMYDRIVFGYVRDMIHALPQWDVFPWIFNIADSLLCVGVAMMVLYSFVYGAQEAKAKSGATAVEERA